MKQIIKTCIFLVLVLLVSMDVMAQVPQGFNFQAIARSAEGIPLSSQNISVQIEVVKGTEDGSVVYTETHDVTTDELGLFNLIIGEGVPAESNDFSSIKWADDNYFVGFGVDLLASGTYESLGKTRLLSVPYALLAQDVVNGSGGSGEIITEINLDADVDTAFTVTITGDEGPVNNSAIIGLSNTFGTNVGVEGKALSQPGSDRFQIGTYGESVGEGAGTHIALYGYASTPDRAGNSSYGLLTEASSLGKFNQGARTFVTGAGSGEIVPIGDPEEENGNFGSFNIGYSTFVAGNANGNTGMDIEIGGDQGSRINIGAEARVFTTSAAQNSGFQAIINGSSTLNRGYWGYISGDNENVGMDLNVEGGTSNIGLIVNAETAAELNGNTIINGDLTVNGNINGEGSGGGVVTDIFLDATVDTAFQVTISGDEGPVNNSAIIGLANTGGTNVGLEGKAHSGLGNDRFQIGSYGEAIGDGNGTHYAFYGYAEAQGKFTQGLRTVVLGPGNGELVPIGDPQEESGNFGSFNQGLTTYVEGNSNGNIGLDIAVGGDQGSRINIGAEARVSTTSAAQNSGIQAIVNGSSTLNRGFWGLVNGDNENVGMDLIVEGGSSNTGLIVSADVAATFNGTVEVNQSPLIVTANGDNDEVIRVEGIGISGGNNSYTDGFVLNHGLSGSVFEMYSGGNQNININGDSGSINAIVVNQTSDARYKTNITSLSGALENTLELRGVSYNWADENRTQETQIGVIAQEVEEIYPEFVHTDEEGMKSVNYSQMVAVLIEAVKELNSKIEVLEAEKSELQAQVDDIASMKTQLNKLMAMITTQTEVESFNADK